MKRPKANELCAICQYLPKAGWTMCNPCARSYDKFCSRGGEAIIWAAKRARKFAKEK